MSRSRMSVRAAIGVLVALCATLALAGPARAELRIASFTATAHDGAGNEVTQAGAHPDVTTTFMFEQTTIASGLPIPSGSVKDIEVVLPPGLIGNPNALPTCSLRDLQADECPPESQVGEQTLFFKPFALPGPPLEQAAEVYNIDPPAGVPAQFGFSVAGILVVLSAEVRTGGDYGLTMNISDLSQILQIYGNTLTFWGVPGAHTPAPERAFMSSPTVCGPPLTTTLRVNSWQHPDRWQTATATTATGPTGCDRLPFAPLIRTVTGSRVVDGTGSVSVDIGLPQSEDPGVLATAHLKQATVRLPEGVTINPGVAHDLTACSDGAFALRSPAASQCPRGSKVGRLGIATPLLSTPIPGDIYLGEPVPGNPFRLFLHAAGSGVRIKLEGSVRPDPVTGQLTTTFDDNPPLPFHNMHLEFQGGSRAVLAMPDTCGAKRTVAALQPWSGQPAALAGDQFLVFADAEQSPCPPEAPFAPEFQAGVTHEKAGGDSGFVVRFRRPDGHQPLSRLELHLPAGLLGRLGDFPLCSNADADADRCSDASKVGGVTVSAGPGKAPLNVAGEVFLTEPRAPGEIAGLAIVVPAVAGPYHLGTPIVRAGITVNADTSLTVRSDPLPTILHGVPLRIQQVVVNLDRGGFMFNPTDCSPKRITGAITATAGTVAKVASPFGVRACDELPFAPRMTIGTTAADSARTTDIRVRLQAFPGHANIRQVQVVLPREMGARLDGPIQAQCTEAQFEADACPEASKVGRSTATTPVLPTPLAGDIYFVANRQGSASALPRLGVRLKGMIALDLVGEVAPTEGGRLVTTFTGVPDAPISDFQLILERGEKAVLTGADLCAGPITANVDAIAHNGRTSRERVRLDVTGCPAKR